MSRAIACVILLLAGAAHGSETIVEIDTVDDLIAQLTAHNGDSSYTLKLAAKDYVLPATAMTNTAKYGESSLYVNALKIVGSDPATTRLVGNGAMRVVQLGSSKTWIEGVTITNGNVSANTVSPRGGCVVGGGILTNCVITGGSGASHGGGVAESGPLWNCVVRGNSANYGGGTMNCSLYNTTLEENTATNEGGGFFNNHKTSLVSGCLVSNNTAKSNGGGGIQYGAGGMLTNSIVTANKAGGNGGGIASNQTTPTYRIWGCVIEGNCGANGGGLASALANDSVIRGNTAFKGHGGGVYFASGAGGTLSNCLIAANCATNTGTCHGGAVYDASEKRRTLLLDSEIAGNAVFNAGGSGVGVVSYCTLTNCYLHDNFAAYYGAVRSCRAVGCTFANNLSNDETGNAYLSDLEGCEIIGSTVFKCTGMGCVFHDIGGTRTLTGNPFSTCIDKNGKYDPTAGAFAKSVGVILTRYGNYTNCLVRNCGKAGGALSLCMGGAGGAPASLVNCTIVSNYIGTTFNSFTYPAWPITALNCVFCGNRRGDGTTNDLIVSEGSQAQVTLSHCVYGLPAARLFARTRPSPHIFEPNPTSPLLGGGLVQDWMNEATDIRGAGFPRLTDGAVDIGCYQGLRRKGLLFTLQADEPNRASWWVATGEAARQLAAWRETPYARKSGKTDFFVRAQLKYGLERADYIHHWYDRPLCQDTTYAAEPDPTTGRTPWLAPKSWAKIVENVNLGKQTGLAVFTSTSGRDSVIAASVTPGAETTILVELIAGSDTNACIRRAEQALAMPNAYRIGGKVVLTGYPAVNDETLAFFAEVKRLLAERNGADKFLIVPYCDLFGDLTTSELRAGFSVDLIARIRTRIAGILRVTDGLHYCARESFYDRRYDPWLFDEIFIPILRSVFAEPEFADKVLGCWATPGHENSYRWNYGLDSTGTQMLRDMLASVATLAPDFLIGCEWDEENENTCFRPTVANGFTHQRILRHFHDRTNGQPFEALPGDDVTRPNLVLSYRKDVMCGEQVEAEVLNIPDGTFAGQTFSVAFAWKAADGTVVRTFPAQELKADELTAAWFRMPASELVDHAALQPELRVTCTDQNWTWSEGFWPLGLHATRTIEYKWVKTPVRELPEGVTGSLQIVGTDEDGSQRVRATVTSPRNLRAVTVLDNTDVVAAFDGERAADDETVRVRIATQGLGITSNDVHLLTGRIDVRNAPSAALSGDTGGTLAVDGTSFVFTKATTSTWSRYLWVDVPRDEATNAVFDIALGPFCRELPLTELIEKEVYAFSGTGGVNLVFSRVLTPAALPAPILTKTADFTFRLKPGLTNSLVRMEVVDEDYRVWRGGPLIFGTADTGRTNLHVFERARNKARTITLDSSRLAKTEYVFEPSRGSVVAGNGGRHLWGILGGYVPLVTGFGRGESSYGNPPNGWMAFDTPGWPKTAPDYVQEEDGSWALAFSGCSYVTLPPQIWPAETGFTLELTVKPTAVTRKQMLLTTGATSSGLYIENGRVYAHCFLCNKYWRESGRAATIVAEGPAIQAGVWQTVRVTSDQKTLRVDVDGTRGEPVEMTGDLFYPLYTVLGVGDNASGSANFEGRMKSLKISAQ